MISLEDRVDWKETDATAVPSDDDRIEDVDALHDLLEEAVEGEGTTPYEHGDEEFDAVEAILRDPDGVAEPISSLPVDYADDSPPGPYVHHGDRYFAIDVEEYRQCDE